MERSQFPSESAHGPKNLQAVIARRTTRQRRAPWQARDVRPSATTSLDCRGPRRCRVEDLAMTNQCVMRVVHGKIPVPIGICTRTGWLPLTAALLGVQKSAGRNLLRARFLKRIYDVVGAVSAARRVATPECSAGSRSGSRRTRLLNCRDQGAILRADSRSVSSRP